MEYLNENVTKKKRKKTGLDFLLLNVYWTAFAGYLVGFVFKKIGFHVADVKQIIIVISMGLWCLLYTALTRPRARKKSTIVVNVLIAMVILSVSSMFSWDANSKTISVAKRDTSEKTISLEESRFAAKPVYGDEYRLANNLDRIKPLALPGEWIELSIEGRKDAVVALIECELRYLGVSDKIEITFLDEKRDTILGHYNAKEKSINISPKCLMEEGCYGNLNAALHEVRHAYQHCICEIYMRASDKEKALFAFDGVGQWCLDLANYEEAQEDYDTYYCLSVEKDARKYAETEAETYVHEIRTLLSEADNQQ